MENYKRTKTTITNKYVGNKYCNGKIIVHVVGLISNNGDYLRKFLQSFILVPRGGSTGNYYAKTDIFEFVDNKLPIKDTDIVAWTKSVGTVSRVPETAEEIEPVVSQDRSSAVEKVQPDVSQDRSCAVEEVEPDVSQDRSSTVEEIEPDVSQIRSSTVEEAVLMNRVQPLLKESKLKRNQSWYSCQKQCKLNKIFIYFLE